ncbi:MAG: hypothetical protein PVH45_00785 [Candidatus Omnitrophota bacterium]|jgi:hypothetical protein
MKTFFSNKKAMTLVEIIVAAAIAVIITSLVIYIWIFTHQVWKAEGLRTSLRVNLLQGIETVKEDIRLSSATFMSFYPAGSDTKTAVSLPRADIDANNMYTLNAFGEIVWDRTVIYHVFTTEEGEKQLRRTAIEPRDNTLDHNERYAQLVQVVTDGDGDGLGLSPAPSTEILLKGLDLFELTTFPAVIDFYEDDSNVQRVGKIVFGWERMSAGDHTIRFECIGKNDDSSDYWFGLDYLLIEPSGSVREVEYYDSSFAPSGALDTSGQPVGVYGGLKWSNADFLAFDAGAAGDWIEFTDYYDLWRESSFYNCMIENVTTGEDIIYMKLELPQDREEGNEEIVWMPHYQTGDPNVDGRNAFLATYPQTARTIIPHDFISAEGDMVRVKFVSAGGNPFKVAAAYITRRDGTTGEDGQPNQATTGLDLEEYHLHQQLFFKDEYDMDSDGDTEDIVPYLYIPAGVEERWSEWAEFPLIIGDSLGNDIDYFITFCVPDLGATSWPTGWSFDPATGNARYWNDSGGGTHTYAINAGTYAEKLQAAGTPVWSGTYVPVTYPVIVAVRAIDIWTKEGTVESDIFDTKKENPVYNQVKWSEVAPSGTEVLMKVRSSDNQHMIGAAEWDSITGSTANPASLSIGSGRYVQFFSELSATPFWEGPTQTLSSADYVDTQLGLGADYSFPQDDGEYMTTGVYSTWIDDVEIDWPGDERICVISGYIARRNDCGQAKVYVDGRELVKTLNVKIRFTGEVREQTVTEESSVAVEPRNTGR